MSDNMLKDKTIAILEEMYFLGYGINEIALTMEWSETAIYQQLERKKQVCRNAQTSWKRLRMIKDDECL